MRVRERERERGRDEEREGVWYVHDVLEIILAYVSLPGRTTDTYMTEQ